MNRQFIIQYSNSEGTYTSYSNIEHSEDCKDKLLEEFSSYHKDDPSFRITYVRALPLNDGTDFDLIDRMRAVRAMCELGHKVRAEAKIKNRQPISKAYVVFTEKNVQDYMIYCDRTEQYKAIIADELNVDDVLFAENSDSFVDILLKPNFKVLGPKGFGKLAQGLKKVLVDLSPAERRDLREKLAKQEPVNACGIDLTLEDIEIEFTPKPGFASATSKYGAIVLDTALDEELLERGFISEFRSAVQNIRKDVKLELSDRISIDVFVDENKVPTLRKFAPRLRHDLLMMTMEFKDKSVLDETLAHKFVIDGETCYVNLYKEVSQ